MDVGHALEPQLDLREQRLQEGHQEGRRLEVRQQHRYLVDHHSLGRARMPVSQVSCVCACAVMRVPCVVPRSPGRGVERSSRHTERQEG
jgi:thymidine phosphorylase